MTDTFYGKSIGLPGPKGWEKAKISALNLSLVFEQPKPWWGKPKPDKQAVKNVSFPIFPNAVTGIMGPSGCGKSTLLKMLNRLHDLRLKRVSIRSEGTVLLDGSDIYARSIDVNLLRSRIGIVLQEPTPLPGSIFENVALPIRLYRNPPKTELADRVEHYLRQAELWSEVSDRLKDHSTSLSGGQQQRLCLARSMAAEPEILLMDEPTSKLDVDSAELIDDMLIELKKQYTIVVVTHSGAQAAYVSDYIAFMYKGELLEFDNVNTIVSTPHTDLASRYIRGRRMTNGKNQG